MWLRAGTLRSKVFFDFRLVKLNSRKPSKLSSNSLFVCNWQRIGEFNINKQTCVCHVMVGRKIDYSRKTYRNGCSLAYIFTHLRSVKMRKNVLVAFRILPTPSTKISSNLAGPNWFYGLVFQGRFWWKNLRYCVSFHQRSKTHRWNRSRIKYFSNKTQIRNHFILYFIIKR